MRGPGGGLGWDAGTGRPRARGCASRSCAAPGRCAGPLTRPPRPPLSPLPPSPSPHRRPGNAAPRRSPHPPQRPAVAPAVDSDRHRGVPAALARAREGRFLEGGGGLRSVGGVEREHQEWAWARLRPCRAWAPWGRSC